MNQYFVRAFGNKKNGDGDPKSYDEAIAELRELYNSCIKGHEEDGYFYEMTLLDNKERPRESALGSTVEMKITGDGYYQCAYVLPVNVDRQDSRTDYLLEELNRTSDAISACAEEYEYRQENMQDVYDKAYHVRKLATRLSEVIQSPEFREKIYREEAQKRTMQPVDVNVVVEGGMVTDICVSTHAEALINARVIDMDTTDPVDQKQNEADLNELQEAVQEGLLKSVY